jgi:hypothetical protein
MLQGVEVHRTTEAAHVKEKVRGEKGKTTEHEVHFGKGSFVIRMDQPYSRLADMLLDTQYYSVNDPRPYDDTGWTLGALHNVRTVRVTDVAILKAPMSRVGDDDSLAPGGLSGKGDVFVVPNRAESQLATLCFRLKTFPIEVAEEPFEVEGHKFPAGSVLVAAANARSALDAESHALGLEVIALDKAPAVKRHRLGLPRVALVHDWMFTQDDGWWRIAFDRCGVPYDYVSVQTLAHTPDLRSRWDVLVLTPQRTSLPRFIHGIQTKDAIPWKATAEYPNLGGPDQADDIRGGVGYEGLTHLQRFLEQGGLVVAAPSTSVLAVRAGLVEAVEVVESRGLRAQGGVYRSTVADKHSPIVYGYGDGCPVYFSQGPVFRAGLEVLAGGGRGEMAEGGGRPSGRGGARDPDVPQGRPFVAPPPRPKPPKKLADIPEERREFIRHLLPPDERLPRVVLQFAKKDDLWVSGMLDKGEELAEKPAVIDCPVGKGHMVLFANNPMWRWETHGSHALVFNAILHWNHLATVPEAPKQAAKEAAAE